MDSETILEAGSQCRDALGGAAILEVAASF